jgi:hypothetical protein
MPCHEQSLLMAASAGIHNVAAEETSRQRKDPESCSTGCWTPKVASCPGSPGWGRPDYGAPRAGDTTTPEEYALCDLLAEGMQLLEQARLVRPKFGCNGSLAGYGWVTARLGRTVLAVGTVQSTVERLGVTERVGLSPRAARMGAPGRPA